MDLILLPGEVNQLFQTTIIIPTFLKFEVYCTQLFYVIGCTEDTELVIAIYCESDMVALLFLILPRVTRKVSIFCRDILEQKENRDVASQARMCEEGTQAA